MFDLLAHHRLRLSVLLLSLCTVVLAGCNRGRATAQVRGKVLYKDGSVPRGGVRVVRFEPAEETSAEIRKAATGHIGDDGSFELATRVPGDGVFLGNYNVTFTVWKAPREPISLVDAKYTQAATTPYQVTVDGDVDDLFFEIEPVRSGNAASAASSATPARTAAPADG